MLTALRLRPRCQVATRERPPGEPLDSDCVDIVLPGTVEGEVFDSTDYDVRSLGGPIDPVIDSRAARRPR